MIPGWITFSAEKRITFRALQSSDGELVQKRLVQRGNQSHKVPKKITELLKHPSSIRWVGLELTFLLLQFGQDTPRFTHKSGRQQRGVVRTACESICLAGCIGELSQPPH